MRVTIVLLSLFILSTSMSCSKPKKDQAQHAVDIEGEEGDLGEKVANSAMELWRPIDTKSTGQTSSKNWNYGEGVVLKGIEDVWKLTGNGSYFYYIQKSIDYYLDEDGGIKSYKKENYKLDDINSGKVLLTLYKVTGDKKYWKAATRLRNQLKTQPRTSEGGFWHKRIYPHQMWLDGLYMAAPFYAEYAKMAHEGDSSFIDIANQFVLMEKHSRDKETGLLFHGWDESKEQKWADPKTGRSPNFWGRAMGWYGMALVDVLENLPEDIKDEHGENYRSVLKGIMERLASAIKTYQDPETGLWWQVIDKGGKEGNFLESSGSAMFVYFLAKGVRKGWLSKKYDVVATKGYEGLVDNFVKKNEAGHIDFYGTCPVAGLGGEPYRSGSYEYYINQKPVKNDSKGVGAFLLAANEMEILSNQREDKVVVTLDNYFNNEYRKDITGTAISSHYVWQDRTNGGFSFWENIFNYHYGAETNTLKEAPRSSNLRETDIFIIVDPDTEEETANPNYMADEDIESLDEWVRNGGVLVLMENDSLNSEFKHFNKLAENFGFHFNEVSRNRVKGRQFEMGAIDVNSGNPIFKEGSKFYMKEVSTLKTPKDATEVLFTRDKREPVAAYAKRGKGVVFLVTDPWFYNEYVDGRKLPIEFENYNAAYDLTKWLIGQVNK